MDLKETAQKRLEEAREARVAVATDYEARFAALSDDAPVEEVEALSSEMDVELAAADDYIERTKKQLAQAETLAEARAALGFRPAGELRVTEPLTYTKENPHGPSFFHDLYVLQTRGSSDARERLEKGTVETRVGLEERGIVLRDAEGRALSSSSTAGGDFLPPLYFGDLYAYFKRARRVTANLVRNLPLAAKGNTITIPRVTGGSTAIVQTADNQNVSNTDPVTAILTIPVCTVAGYVDLSRQIVERSEPGLDQIVVEDLLMDYNKSVNSYCVNGTGSNGQPTGILVQSNVNSITYTSASPTVYGLYPKVLDAVRQITEAIFEPSVGIIMTARRWAWILAAVDSSNRPFAVASTQGPYNALGLHNEANASFLENMVPAGSFAGYPVYIDETISKVSGASTNQDSIFVGAFNEDILWEDPAGPRQFTFEGVTSQTAAIRVQVFGYMAFTAGRYPAGNSKITGTGLTAPTF